VEPIRVVELRQWSYCPRIVYYHGFMPGAARDTYKMKEGLRAQELIERLELRRTLGEYGLSAAERQFGVRITDEASNLTGMIDLVLKGAESASVVDFKLTAGEVGENHRIQLAGYATLAEAALGLPVDTAFLYRIPDGKVFPVPITGELRLRVKSAIESIRAMQMNEALPEATLVRARCIECEYANFCADVW
jgi:CRISPR-associated exonuclease Cas4